MPKTIAVSIGSSNFTLNTGDLTSDTFANFAHGGLSLASNIMEAAMGHPISSLSTDFLEAGVSTGTSLGWNIGNISLQFSPGVEGKIAIRKAGEVFRFTEAENDDDDAKREVIVVPVGSAYVTLSLRVTIGVGAAGGFSNGTVGIKGSVQTTDSFLIANHIKVPANITVGEALKDAFALFLFPFSDDLYRRIPNGNFLEHQFYGKLNVELATSLGFAGVLFGGMSGGDLRRSFTSPVGTVTAKAKPEFNLGAQFTLGYQHEDSFRIVLRGLSDRSRLFLFKTDASTLSAGLTVSAGVSLNASIDLQLQVDDLIDKAANRLFAGVADLNLRNTLITQFAARVKSGAGELAKYVEEAEQKINDQIRKLDKLKVSAGVAFERISEHAVLLSIDFDKSVESNGYKRAIHGDMVGAFTEPGTELAPGSYTRSEIRKSTSLSFQIFEAFSATSIQTYFEKSELRYAGNGVFQLRFDTGVTASSNVFGHRKAVEFYFEITAATTAKGAISDQDIKLHINTTDANNVQAAHLTASMLHLILRNTPYDGLDDTLLQTLNKNPKLTVNVGVVVASSAYRRLRCTPFIGKKPNGIQTADALNYAAFVNAVDKIYAGGGFGTQGFPDAVDEYKNWAHYNITVNDEEDSKKPPNRRDVGNAGRWPQDATNFPAASADNSVKSMLRTFMIAAQQFMNLCEDLPTLAKDLDAATTKDTFQLVLKESEAFVKEGAGAFPLFFTKPFVAAFFAQSMGTVSSVQAPAATDPISTFDVLIQVD